MNCCTSSIRHRLEVWFLQVLWHFAKFRCCWVLLPCFVVSCDVVCSFRDALSEEDFRVGHQALHAPKTIASKVQWISCGRSYQHFNCLNTCRRSCRINMYLQMFWQQRRTQVEIDVRLGLSSTLLELLSHGDRSYPGAPVFLHCALEWASVRTEAKFWGLHFEGHSMWHGKINLI